VLAEGLVARGRSVTCLVSNTTRRTEEQGLNGVRVIRAARLSEVFSTPVCPSFFWKLKGDEHDIIHVHEPNPIADACVALRRKTRPLVLSYHSDVVRQWWAKRSYYQLLDRVLNRADRVVVATEAHIHESDILRRYASKCQIIPYGIPLHRLALTEDVRRRAQAVRETFPFDYLILAVGRLVSYKGFENLIHALCDVPDAGLVIVGGGPLERHLRGAGAAAALDGRVQFAGQIDDATLLAHYHAADLVVMPSISRAEAFGLVQVEAMACGKPVVSTLLPSGAPTVNVSGETGLCVEPGNASALADALNELLRDDSLRGRMGENGRRRVAEHYGADRMVEAYDNLYELLAH
jgi:rhamnosyl/mannosyltransferase